MSNSDTFPNPKPGDPIAWRSRYDKPYQRLIIARVTALQITTDCGRRFTRKRGWPIPASSYGGGSAQPWTEEIDRRIAEEADRAAFKARMTDACNRLSALELTARLHADKTADLPKFEAFVERVAVLVEEFTAP